MKKENEVKIIVNDCVEAMRAMEENSVDAIVTDPPYGLEFMGKDWDKLAAPDATTLADPAEAGGFQDGAGGNPYSRGRVRHGKKASSMAMVAWHENWAREALRVLKPGGHLLVFGGSRTYHSMAMGVELAGFEIRDQIQWVYGQGFPKSMNVGKAIDKAGGINPATMATILRSRRESSGMSRDDLAEKVGCTPSSIRDWEEGRSRAKGLPLEFMVPSEGYLCRLADVLGYTADERRKVGISTDRRGDGTVYGIGHSGELTEGGNTPAAKQWDGWGTALKPAHEPIVMARKPLKGTVASNVLEHGTGAINVDGCRVPGVKPDTTRGAGGQNGRFSEIGAQGRIIDDGKGRWPANLIHDGSDEATEGLGAAARYFYCAKPSKAEKNAGLGEDFETKQTMGGGGTNHEELGGKFGSIKAPQKNHHPTVKPVALMAYLCRLVTPPGGTVLDPFLGSGTTGVAAVSEGFDFIGIEREQEYADIADARIRNGRE